MSEAISQESAEATAAPVYAEFEELEEAYALPAEPFDIVLEDGKRVQARALCDATAILGVEKHVQLVKQTLKSSPQEEIKKLKQGGPIDPTTLRMCVYLEAFLVRPAKPWFEWYRVSRITGMLVPEMFNKLSDSLERMAVEAFDTEVEEAKNA